MRGVSMATEQEHDGHELRPDERELVEAVRRAHSRREHSLKAGVWPVARGLAMIGRYGWTIVMPILIGAFIGRWLDRTLNSGVFFSATLVFAGAAFGFWAVWKRMGSE